MLEIEVNDHNIEHYFIYFPVSALYNAKDTLSELAKRRVLLPTWLDFYIPKYLRVAYNICLKKRLIEYRHYTLGWYNNGKTDVFLYDKSTINGVNSICSREAFSFTKGDKQTYLDFLKETVYPIPTLSLALSVGYSAVVASRLKDMIDTGVIIVNLCGASSTGKTTAEQLLVSPFACPRISNKGGLVRTFSSTLNATYAGIEGINGLPIVLDDVTTAPNLDLANLIYTIASGEEKSRCTSDGKLRTDGRGWSGLVVISSETPIQDAARQNQGLQVRVIQTQDITWTPSAETAEYIKRVVLNNYGFTGKEFAEYVGKIDIDDLFVKYQESEKAVDRLMTKRDNLTDRLASKYAVIHLTITLMNDCFGTTLDAEALIKILLEPEQRNVENRDIATKALNLIVNYIVRNKSNFFWNAYATNEPDRFPEGINLGTIRVLKDGSWNVYIPTETTQKLLLDNGINETAAVKKRWKERNITKCDADHNSVKYNLSGTVRRCDCFVFRHGIRADSYIDELNDAKAPKARNTQSAPVSNYTIDDDEAIDALFIDEEETKADTLKKSTSENNGGKNEN
ncbi:MAG: DUF927 domain-containing protein [Candidatus Borkfalkiaceae bacterium]|nr:DUF927 domain-containing protein [Christensenellaceae bacterium]